MDFILRPRYRLWQYRRVTITILHVKSNNTNNQLATVVVARPRQLFKKTTFEKKT